MSDALLKEYDRVVEAGKIDMFSWSLDVFTMTWLIALLVFVVLIVLTCYVSSVTYVNSFVEVVHFVSLSFCAVFLFVYPMYVNTERVDQAIEEWKVNDVDPLFEKLPLQKSEIVYVKIDPEISNELRGGLYWHATNTEKLTPLVVSFKTKDGVETLTNWFNTKMELTDEEKPYIEYKRLHKHLGNDIKSGIYEARIYLPKDYTFTDIK